MADTNGFSAKERSTFKYRTFFGIDPLICTRALIGKSAEFDWRFLLARSVLASLAKGKTRPRAKTEAGTNPPKLRDLTFRSEPAVVVAAGAPF